MAKDSKIEWCHHTDNLWHGCEEVNSGCDHCYARVLSERWGRHIWGSDVPRLLINSFWSDLNKFQKLAKEAGQMHRVFVGSMMDIFEKPMPLINNKGTLALHPTNEPAQPIDTGFLRQLLFESISQGNFPNLIFLFLTKRPSNINKYIPEIWKTNPPKNVMYGCSLVTQDEHLLKQFMKVNGHKFLSVEPQLEHIDLTNKGMNDAYNTPTRFENGKGIEWTDPGDKFIGLSWIIEGGESGGGKRPFNLDWAYSLMQQCKDAGVPYFFKQIDKKQPIPDDLMVREFPAYHSDVNYFK